MVSLRYFGSLFIFIAIARIAGAQSYFFSSLTTNDGLPANAVTSIVQDNRNFIWIGTTNGLTRYDGYSFLTFKREAQENSLPFNEISSLLVDGENLWVGTWGGLCRLNTKTFQITRIDLNGNNTVRTIYKERGPDGLVWVGTATGLVSINADDGIQHYTRESSNLSHNTIRAIFQDKSGSLWVGTYDKLNKLNHESRQFTTVDMKKNHKPQLKNNLICDIKPVEGHDSLIWVGTETGLCRVNVNTFSFTVRNSTNTSLSNEVIKNIYSAVDGKLWLGTDFGLNVYDPSTGGVETFFHNPQTDYSIANNVIWQIYEDRGGVIWIVTSNGLSRANKYNHLFNFHPVSHKIEGQDIGNQVKALLTTRDGNLWIATIHGVVRLNRSDGTKKVFETNGTAGERLLLDNVFALEEDDHGRVWIGTAGGINVWDGRKNKMYAITATGENGLSSNYIARFVKARDGQFWVAAWEGGLYKIVKGFEDLSDVRFEYAGDFGTDKAVYAMNAIWSVSNNNLFRIDLNSYSTTVINKFRETAGGNDIYALYATPKGVIWAGTLNGLIEYNPATDSCRFHQIITGRETVINNIIGDENDNVWAGAHRCIVKLARARQKTEIFPLDKELPLNTFYNNCSTRDPDGHILFGGDNGYIRFHPSISPNPYSPPVVITNLLVNNKRVAPLQVFNDKVLIEKDISALESLQLDYSQRSVAFEFAALHFWQPEINVYAYKLEGFDETWNYVSGKKNFVVYSNLPPGIYELKIRGTNNYGIWSPHEASLSITVDPPLFLSTPFKILYTLLAALFIIAALRIYAVRLKLKNDVKIAVIEKEHAEEIVSTKQNFFTSISHELRTPISLIVPPIQEILKRGKLDEEDRALISIAEKNSQRLLRLINQILDYRKLEHENQSLTISWFDTIPFCQELYALFTDKAARNEIDFIFTTDKNECPLWADREKVEIIVFNLLSNAFKFTPRRGRIELSVTEQFTEAVPEGWVVITVSDNGIGMSDADREKIFGQFFQTEEAKKIEDGSGIGLTLVSEYLKMHRGRIEVESAKGSGSTFTVMLPRGSSHFPIDQRHTGQHVSLVAVKPVPDVDEDKYEFNLRSEKPVVLLVEDNVDMVDLITLTLREKYNFIVSNNGEEGLLKAAHIVPEVIISDIMMPVMDGLEFCHRIKKDSKTSHIPIILLTARSLNTHKVEGIRAGADVYITKPFEIEILEAHIDHLLERKEELTQYFKQELLTEPVTGSGRDNEDDRFLRKVMNSIESNIANPDFSVEVLSEEMGMSSTHLYRKLKSLTQLGANEIIKKYRIKKASLLLKNKEGNITEIMYEVGFSNLSYFSKCFRAEFGMTPKEYQQKESRHTYNVHNDIDSGERKEE